MVEKEAVKHADSVLAKTQPTTNVMYQSKGFREAPKVMKYFSTPLEKLFQMATSMPEKARRGMDAYIARYAAGAIITGLVIALMQRKFDEDDDRKTVLKKLAYYGAAEPASAHLPLAMFTNSVSWALGRAIGMERRPSPQRDFFPLLDTAEDAVTDISGGRWGDILKDAARFAGYAMVLPTVQAERIMKAVEDRDPYGAVVGRR